MLNARIRKRWLKGDFKIALIGEKVDLTYDYDYLGAGPDSLLHFIQQRQAARAKADHSDWAGRAGAPRRRRDSRASRRRRRKSIGGVGGDWNGLSMLHTAAARVGALDLGFAPARGGLDAHDFVKAGALDLDLQSRRRRDRHRAWRLRRLHRHRMAIAARIAPT